MRRRKLVTILSVVMAWLLVASTALAVVTIEGNNVFGNGHAITIDRDEATGQTRVSSSEAGAVSNDVGSRDVSGYDVYGGSNGREIDEDTSVTINGGTVGDVYGGGLNGDVDGSTNVTVNGGTTGDVYGGGNAVGEDADKNDRNGQDVTANVSGNTNVTVNGGTTGDVYGGGNAEGGDADGRNTSQTVYGGDAEAIVGGDTNVTIDGGTVDGNVYGGGRADSGETQGSGVNDGDADASVRDDAKVTISGGTVTGAVKSGGKEVDNDADAWVDDDSVVTIDGGKIASKKVYLDGAWDNKLILKDPSALYYTYYLDAGILIDNDVDVQNNVVREYWNHLTFDGYCNDYYVYSFKCVPQPKDKTVTFIYKFGAEEVFRETKSVTMDFWDSNVTLNSSWSGNDNLNAASGSKTMSYNGPNSSMVIINVTPRTKTGTVTFNYMYNGVIHFTENKEGTVTYGAAPITLSSSWDGNENVFGGSGSGEVSFAEPTKVVTITVEPRSTGITVRFIYLYGTTVVSVDEQSVNLTYGDPAKTVTPAPFSVRGYYLLAPVSPVTVDFESMLELEEKVIEIDVLLGRDRTDDDDDTPQIPLGPGTPGTVIPLGVGVPSTGDSTGISILLMALGVAVVAFIAAKAKRSSAR